MSIRQIIINYFQDRRRYRLLIGGGVAVLAVLIILFNQDLGNLLRWLRGQALETSWTMTSDLVNETMHSKSISINHPDGNRYLYVIGGAEQYMEGSEKRLRLLDTVQRVKLDENGKIAEELIPGGGGATEPANWEGGTDSYASWAHMYAGHAEFGLVDFYSNDLTQHWLLVVSGDIHVPDVSDPNDEIYNPLLFSTIEKLDLNNEALGWQPIALVSGVNFYPEVLNSNGKLKIVGGVYGNVFAKYYNPHPWYDNGYYNVKDPLLPDDDKTKWNDPVNGYQKLFDYKDGNDRPRVFGNVGISLKDGGFGDNIFIGDTDNSIEPGFPGIGFGHVGMADGQVHIQDLGDNTISLADLLAKELMNGNFATTVSEHYEIDMGSNFGQHFYSELGTKTNTLPSGNPKDIEAGGNDYDGTVSDVWPEPATCNGVVHIGHLRIIVYCSSWLTEPLVLPAPQGRYGHKLVEAGQASSQRLYVLGGASWSSPVFRPGPIAGWLDEIYNFWVIEDAYDPITMNNIYQEAIYDYQFVGNRSYEWNSVNQIWKGTNDAFNANDGYHRFDETNFKPLSGAFFGLATLAPKPNVTEFLAVGGLANSPDSTKDFHEPFPLETGGTTWPALRSNGVPITGVGIHKWGISVKVLDGAKHYSFEDNAWNEAVAGGPSHSFGASAVGIGGYAVTFGGQSTFQGSSAGSDAPFDNDLVPDINDAITPQTWRYNLLANGAVWGQISNFNAVTAFYATGNVITDPGFQRAKTIYIYKAGGGAPGVPTNLSDQVEYLGPFTFGAPGVVDPGQSTIDIVPLRNSYTDVDVNNDEVLESVPTVWNDHYDYATATITFKDYYGTPVTSLINPGMAASLYTSRSTLPAIDKYPPKDTKQDDIRIIGGDATEGTGWPPEWQDQMVLVDSQGQAKFRMLSGVATDDDYTQPPFITVYGYWANINENYSSSQLKIGAAPMIFTIKNHPSPIYSDLTADPLVVTADDIDTSTLTGIVKDYNNQPLPGFKVKITSNRNKAVDPDPDHFDPGNVGIIELDPNSSGIVTTTVHSAMRGPSIMKGYYTIPLHNSDGLNPPDLPQQAGFKSVMIWFTLEGKIISLMPSSGKQTQTLYPLTAIGQNTVWDSSTTIDFIPPSSRFSLEDETDMDNLHLVADGVSITSFVVNANTAGEAVQLEILEGGGYLLPQYATQETIYANSSKQAHFQYEASDTAGILKIRATLSDNSSSQLWLPLVDADGYFGMDMIPDPKTLTSPGSMSVVNVIPSNFGVNIPVSDITWGNPAAITDDNGNISGVVPNTTGNAGLRFNYTSDSQNGVAHVFVIGTYHQGQSDETKLVAMTSIIKNYSSAGAGTDITFVSPFNLNITTPEQLEVPNGIAIGAFAPIGLWNFLASTVVNQGGADVIYTETAPFMVYDSNYATGPYIDKIDPNRGLRGTEDLQITITGLGTNFVGSGPAQSVVTFTPVNPYLGSDPHGVTATTVSATALELIVNVDITDHATMGYWNVVVTTGPSGGVQEVAEMIGDHDFLVTTPSGYFIDVYAMPDSIPRDGQSTSNIIAKVGYFNESTGSITDQTNKLVNFAFSPLGSDAGSLNPLSDDTNNDGEAYSVYTTDLGETNDEVTISAGTVIDATLTIYGTVMIYKEGVNANSPSRTESTMSAWSPVPIDTNGDGDPYSTVTVTVCNSLGAPLIDKQVSLASNRSADTIAPPVQKNTDINGKAVFRVSSSLVGISELTGTITEGDIQLKAYVKFVPDDGTLVLRNWKIVVPFQARDYNNWVRIIIKDTVHTGQGDTYYNETYLKNARDAATDPNVLASFQLIPTYLYADSGTTYTLWVKGKNHLAKDRTGITSGTTTELLIDFGPLTNNRGLLIGDIVKAAGATAIPGGFHDNVIGTAGLPPRDDLGLAFYNWFGDLDLADLNYDGIVNSVDILYILTNLGSGSSMP